MASTYSKQQFIRQSKGFALATLVLSLLIGATHWRLFTQSGGVPLAQYLAQPEQYLLIDARAQIDYASAHIPQALSLNLDNWEQQFPLLLDQWDLSQSILVYCNSDSCAASKEVATRLQQDLNFANIYTLQGGWQAYQDSL